MENKNAKLADEIIPLVGGAENVTHATHCMTRLRLNLKDYGKADISAIKKVNGVLGCQETGGQLQIIIGTTVADVYKEFCKKTGVAAEKAIDENLDGDVKKKVTFKSVVNDIFGYLSGCMTPLIPVLIAASLCRTVVALFGPQMFGVMSETSDAYKLFTILGDTGFYFLPIFIGANAAKKLNMNMMMGIFIAAVMIHPNLVQMAAEGASFSVYGIPCSVQNYSSTVLPILLTIWAMSHIEKWVNKISPDVIKVVAVPFFTLLLVTPLALCVFGPLGNFMGNYVCGGIIALYDIAGPVAVALLAAFFGLIVCTGMHSLLFVYLFTTFPMLGFDGFMIPGMIAGSWAGAGVALACFFKFKKPENKSMIVSYLATWFFGGVGEPMLYGLNLRYRTTLYASVLAGALTGFVTGLIKLKAYVLSASNGMYGILAFMGGPKWNYIALAIMLVTGLVSGFVIMMLFPLKDEAD